ncbi:MAG: hypothetical protein JNK45_32155, partial [Myxococcales bacterium]|nr:hypothetical protein [Myxococcales bacterium]
MMSLTLARKRRWISHRSWSRRANIGTAMDPATSTPLVLWIPQGHAERGESFWTAVPALVVEASGHSVGLVGEPAPGDRVWISIRVGGL